MQEIQLEVPGKPAVARLALPPGGSGPGVLLLHAWWGLKPFFRTLSERLAQQGYVVLAPDLNDGAVAQTVAEAEALMKGRDFARSAATVRAAFDALRAHPACRGAQVGVVGFSMGGGWALETAAAAPQQVAAVVLYYGNGQADYARIRARVLGHFSPTDEWEPYEFVQATEQALRAAGSEVTFHLYPGVRHWFVEEDRPEYDPAAAGLAWERTVAFLKESLPPA